MTKEVRAKLRISHLGKGEGKSYRKYYGRHEHRVVAEKKLGRKLRKGEVVHHIDGDKLNNSPDNLMVFSSQEEHAAWHSKHDDFLGNERRCVGLEI
ncbi:HNH endonuclease signature motif containing protein [Clostridium sp. 'deep sea']|uniref:HNH endonuclease signature motif containing protein n=1 Tax=Clostridium sp. 'deep sea' TaxID=2779445 RepID=UPI001FAE143D|nr:HNH endonuclease signature motif containing protein [Clostridium sp. 'deep sea']